MVAVRARWQRSRADRRRRVRLRPGPAAILGLALLGAPVRGEADGAAVIRVLDGAGRPRAEASIVARCPDGRAWRARADAEGFAVLASVPSCLLLVEAEAGDQDDVVRVERLDIRAVALLEGAFLRDLPSSRNAWSLLETAEPAAILDRIDGAGLHLGEPGRFSMRGASWTQNTLLFDGVDLTDPVCGGIPLSDPDVDVLERIEAISGLAPVEQLGAGIGLVLVPLAPGPAWHGTLGVDALGAGLQQAEGAGQAPSIARFGTLADVRASASGPLSDRLRVLFSARYGRVRRMERNEAETLEATHIAGSGQVLHEPNERHTLRLHASAQAVRRPLAGAPAVGDAPRERADVFGAQVHWTHASERRTATAFGGMWSGLFEPQANGRGGVRPVERLLDGPVPELVSSGSGRRSTWTVGGGFALSASRLGGVWHAPRLGATVGRASVRDRARADLAIPETVNGLPARLWEYTWPGPDSRRHVRSIAAWAADRIVLRDRLFVEAGLRLDTSAGMADGAAQGISWTTLSPRLAARLRLTGSGRLAVFGGYADYPHRLLLAPLAFGDPNGSQAGVYRWDDANGDGRFEPTERGVLIARVGPGAADGALAAIDPHLRPPRTREFVVGLELSPVKDWLVRLTGFDRRERDLPESVNIGVPLSSYTVRYLPDPAGDIVGTQDDQLLPIYDRKPETFGLDRYLLTNPPGHTGLHQGVELRVQKALGTRFALLAGGTASRTEIQGASRGFRVMENDQGVVGELQDDPNADTHSSGRSFFDRAYTLKVAAIYRASGDWRFGAVARYQDGQPFGRVVVVPDLAQGPEAVPATPRGQIARSWAVDEEGRYVVPSGHRFMYTLTVDARVEKGVALGTRRLGLIAEAFNLLGTRDEVEENPVWGPGFRTPTAVQPPRVVRFGLRFDF